MTVDSLLTILRSFWMIWVMAIFLGIVFWAYRPKNKKKVEEWGHIPLNDDK